MRSEINVGIDVSRANRMYRGIPIYTRSVLGEFGKASPENVHFILTHFPEDDPETDFGLTQYRYEQIPYSGKYVPWVRMIQEQVLYPIFQRKTGMDVFWHPQNHAQFFTPVGYVLTLHDTLPLSRKDLSQDLDTADVRALYKSRVLSARQADTVITVSEFSKQEIIDHIGVAPHNVRVIYNGIDKTTFRPDLSKEEILGVKEKYDLPPQYLLTVGSYSPHKNLGCLLEAYSKSSLPAKGIGLVMVGPKDEQVYTSDSSTLESEVETSGLAKMVRMLSPVPVGDLVAIYNGAKMFAITSEYEGFGFPPLEAMACGVPVVSSTAASLPEVCGRAALYADPNDPQGFSDQFDYLLAHELAGEKLIRAGFEQSSIYSWERTARKTLNTLLQVAGR